MKRDAIRRSTVVAAAAALLVVVAIPAGAKPTKQTVCHVPPGNAGNAHEIEVSSNSLAAHLGHGDFEGACEREVTFTFVDTAPDGDALTVAVDGTPLGTAYGDPVIPVSATLRLGDHVMEVCWGGGFGASAGSLTVTAGADTLFDDVVRVVPEPDSPTFGPYCLSFDITVPIP